MVLSELGVVPESADEDWGAAPPGIFSSAVWLNIRIECFHGGSDNDYIRFELNNTIHVVGIENRKDGY